MAIINPAKLINEIESDRRKLEGKELHSEHIFTKDEYLALAEYIFSFKCFSINYSVENAADNMNQGVVVRILL